MQKGKRGILQKRTDIMEQIQKTRKYECSGIYKKQTNSNEFTMNICTKTSKDTEMAFDRDEVDKSMKELKLFFEYISSNEKI